MLLGIAGGLDQFPGDGVGLVVALALLVLDDAPLLVELLLLDRAEQMPHAVRLHPQRNVERGGRHVLEVVRPIVRRGAVEIGGADPLHRLEVILVVVLRSVEHQVLEQVGEAGLAGLFVLGPDVIPDVHGDDGRLVVLVHQQGQAVVEHEFLIGNVDLAGVHARHHHGDNQQVQR
jgi:hypothetical protein